MPLYDFRCACGKKESVFRKIAERNDPLFCSCLQAMERVVIVAPTVRGDYAGYTCPITDKWIEGKRAHEENLARHDCRVYEPGEREARIRSREKSDADFEARVEDTVEEFIHKLPTQKREQLASELAAGVTAEAVRS